jgi:hypothetical protein
MATLLFRDKFNEDVDLSSHAPNIGGGTWEYDGASSLYVCHNSSFSGSPSGYLDTPSGGGSIVARNPFVLPVGATRWRAVIDIYRSPVENGTGGGFEFYAYCAPGSISSFSSLNTLVMGVRRVSANSVQFSAIHVRPASPPGPATVNIVSCDVLTLGWRRYIMEVDELLGTVELFLADAFTGLSEITALNGSTSGLTGTGDIPAELATHISTDTGDRLIGILTGWATVGLVYFAGRDLQIWQLPLATPQVESDPPAPVAFPFKFEPPIPETFRFATRIIETEDQTEQRLALSDPALPRRKIQARIITHEPGESDHLMALLFGNNTGRYWTPQWQHVTRLDVDAAITDTTLQLRSTAFRELIPGRKLMLWTSWNSWEIVEILTVDSGVQVTLVDPLAGGWLKGITEVIPLRIGTLEGLVPFERPTSGLVDIELDWTLEASL